MEPASAKVAKQPRREQAPGGSDRTDATRATKKRKQADSPEGILRRAITDAIVSRSAQAGWDAFQARGDVGLQTDQLAQLLFLFTGHDTWAEHLRVDIPGAPAPPAEGGAPKELHLDWAAVLERYVREVRPADIAAAAAAAPRKHGKDQNPGKGQETLVVGLARLHALQGNAQAAFDAAEQMAAAEPTQVRLRTYTPALAAYAKSGDAEGAMRVHARAQALSAYDSFVDETEAEYLLLLHAVCASGSYAQLAAVLSDMSHGLAELAPATLQLLTNHFASTRAGAAFETPALARVEATAWQAQWVDINPAGDGVCTWAGARLREVSLSDADWGAFAKGLREMANRSEQQNGAFDAYVQWLERNPTDVLLDGANIALYSQNFTEGGFSWNQIRSVFEAAEAANPGKRVAVILHTGRYNAKPSKAPAARAFIKRLEANKQLYITPRGSNDDWYWLYGVVHRKKEGMLVSNDEMRDHIFELMRPKFFLKWKAHHQFKFSFTPNYEASLLCPPRYSTCVQWLPEANAWMLPESAGRWLCIKPLAA